MVPKRDPPFACCSCTVLVMGWGSRGEGPSSEGNLLLRNNLINCTIPAQRGAPVCIAAGRPLHFGGAGFRGDRYRPAGKFRHGGARRGVRRGRIEALRKMLRALAERILEL